MFILVDLTASNCVKSLEEIVSRTGRDKSHVRDALYKLMDQDLVIESGSDAYTIAPAFWLAYEKELHRSLIVDAERRQRKQHQKERRENERRLKEGRDEWRAERDPKVVSMAAKRRRDLDREARLAQPVANEHLTKQQKAWREEERLMRDYDRHVERTMKRLGRRSSG